MPRRKFYASDGQKYRSFVMRDIFLQFEPEQRWLKDKCPRYVAVFKVETVPPSVALTCRRLTGEHRADGTWDDLAIIWQRLPPHYERYEFKRSFRSHVQNQLRMLVAFGLVKVPGRDGVLR